MCLYKIKLYIMMTLTYLWFKLGGLRTNRPLDWVRIMDGSWPRPSLKSNHLTLTLGSDGMHRTSSLPNSLASSGELIFKVGAGQMDRQTDRQADRQRERETDRQTDTQTDRQTGRQTAIK